MSAARPGPGARDARRRTLNLPVCSLGWRRYYFALVVKNQIVYLAMADKSISDIEAAHRFLKDISTKCASPSFATKAASFCLSVCCPRGAHRRRPGRVNTPVCACAGSRTSTANRDSGVVPIPAPSSSALCKTRWCALPVLSSGGPHGAGLCHAGADVYAVPFRRTTSRAVTRGSRRLLRSRQKWRERRE